MSNTKKEIECIHQLQRLGGNLDDLLAFLQGEGLVPKDEIRFLRMNPEVPKAIQALLAKLSRDGKLQLLEYEWTILPIERIKINIVTDRATKEFVYNF